MSEPSWATSKSCWVSTSSSVPGTSRSRSWENSMVKDHEAEALSAVTWGLRYHWERWTFILRLVGTSFIKILLKHWVIYHSLSSIHSLITTMSGAHRAWCPTPGSSIVLWRGGVRSGKEKANQNRYHMKLPLWYSESRQVQAIDRLSPWNLGALALTWESRWNDTMWTLVLDFRSH